MATGSPFMGTLKGKLGETVAMRRNGKQVLRSYISNPKNPNSQKQQVQRMVQATAAQAYSAFKKICDHSFEGVQVGQKSMSYFMSKNMDLLRSKIEANPDGTLIGADADFVVKGVNLPVLNPYVVAKGTLPEVSTEKDNNFELSDASQKTFVVLGQSELLKTESIISEWINSSGGQIGDWFTFLLMIREAGSFQNGQQVYRFGFVRFVVDVYEDSENTELILRPSLSSNGILNNGYDEFFMAPKVGEGYLKNLILNFKIAYPNLTGEADGDQIDAFCCIHSRQNVGGTWQRSNAEFKVRNNITALNITYPSNFDAALDSYAGAGQAKGTGDYVLNGGV